jgi:Tfp pilus assembly pilus retraction ATPase PilT
MEKLNSYLQQMLNSRGYELHLEPNMNPYILTEDGRVDASNSPLPGAQINSMVFALIPNEVKQKLPSQPEIDFEHPHVLGKFGFHVKKSPSGFNVTIKVVGESANATPIAASTSNTVNEADVAADSTPSTPDQSYEVETFESEPALEPAIGNTAEEISETPVQAAPEFHADLPTTPEIVAPAPEYHGVADFETAPTEIEVEKVQSPVGFEIEHGGAPLDARRANEVNRQSLSDQPVMETSIPEYEMPSIESTIEIESAPQDFSDQAQSFENPVSEAIPPGSQTEPAAPALHPQQPVAAKQNNFTPANPEMRSEMNALFAKMAEIGASDLHLSVSMPPLVRMDGKMKPLEPTSVKLTPDSMNEMLSSIMPQKNIDEFKERNDTDFAYEIKGLARFRANIFRDRKGMGGVFRIIPSEILTAEDLKLPKAIMDLCELSKGLVVVTGPTGSGKSTTLCAMVDSINKESRRPSHHNRRSD